ncbi:hypothetical protein AMTR_s00106p00078980 [Amborella trichopoda]|uniref:Uncharacterized protein n=1 Tax=Amborella trichopoda TaxID=13333 RepID=W1NYI8_AMBTC|nr:hypothetical protein AMTR_s00106p00078980 [Amborella trichopoda]
MTSHHDEIKEDSNTHASFTVTEETELASSELADYQSIDAEIRRLEEPEELALIAVSNFEDINYNQDWIVDLGRSNHLTRGTAKFLNLTEYKGGKIVVTANNTRTCTMCQE